MDYVVTILVIRGQKRAYLESILVINMSEVIHFSLANIGVNRKQILCKTTMVLFFRVSPEQEI